MAWGTLFGTFPITSGSFQVTTFRFKDSPTGTGYTLFCISNTFTRSVAEISK